jgi:hypothetical protein
MILSVGVNRYKTNNTDKDKRLVVVLTHYTNRFDGNDGQLAILTYAFFYSEEFYKNIFEELGKLRFVFFDYKES